MVGDTVYATDRLWGIRRSTDHIASWQQVNRGLTSLSVESFAVAGDYAYVFTAPAGVFRARLDGSRPPAEYRFDYEIAAGMSFFSPALHTLQLASGDQLIDLTSSGGEVRAHHLVQLGSTLVIALEHGRFEAAIARDGVLLFGRDFPIDAGKGYVINTLEPISVVMDGMPHGTRVGAPGEPLPDAATDSRWIFVVAGSVDDMTVLPSGARLRVENTRTGDSRDAALGEHGQFTLTLADLNQQPVVEDGDLVSFQLVSESGQRLGRPDVVRIGRDHLDQAFLLTTLSARPPGVELLANYPNPFNPETWIPFTLDEFADVTIRIYGVRGGLVRSLDVGRRNAGYHLSRAAAAYWDGRNALGETVGGGIYFYRIEAGNTTATRRMAVAK